MDKIQSIKQRFEIIGNDLHLNRAIGKAIRVSPTDISVLVTGESGVGKESIPRIIHQLSLRKHGKFIAVNCGAIPEGTIDSELFGHEKGAFTGATSTRSSSDLAANLLAEQRLHLAEAVKTQSLREAYESRGGNVGFRSELGQRRKGDRLRMAKHKITDFTKSLRHAGMLLLNLRHQLIEGLGLCRDQSGVHIQPPTPEGGSRQAPWRDLRSPHHLPSSA